MRNAIRRDKNRDPNGVSGSRTDFSSRAFAHPYRQGRARAPLPGLQKSVFSKSTVGERFTRENGFFQATLWVLNDIPIRRALDQNILDGIEKELIAVNFCTRRIRQADPRALVFAQYIIRDEVIARGVLVR